MVIISLFCVCYITIVADKRKPGRLINIEEKKEVKVPRKAKNAPSKVCPINSPHIAMITIFLQFPT